MAHWSAYNTWSNPMNPYQQMSMYSPYYTMPNMSYGNQGHIPHAPRPLYDQSNVDDAFSQTPKWRVGLASQQHQASTQQTHQQQPPPYQHSQSMFVRESPSRPAIPFDSPYRKQDQAAEAPAQPTSTASSKPTSPLDTRSAMREHVMKMGEQAKERTKSQANIGRTVLYDPFQDVQQRDITPPEPVKQEDLPTPTPQRDNLGHFPLLGLNMIPGLNGLSGHGQDPFPITLAPTVQMPFNANSVLSENDLRDSSPDREWQRETVEPDHDQEIPMPHNSTLKPWDADQLDEWLWSGNKFARQEDFHRSILASDATPSRRKQSSITTVRPIGPPSRFDPPPMNAQSSTPGPNSNILTTRLLVPVLENLASYVQGPIEKRRDYFCQWVKAPEWAIDRSATGNDSFFDSQWGQPPARLGRDPRYQPVPRGMDVRFGNFDAPRTSHTVAMPGMDRRFGFGGGF